MCKNSPFLVGFFVILIASNGISDTIQPMVFLAPPGAVESGLNTTLYLQTIIDRMNSALAIGGGQGFGQLAAASELAIDYFRGQLIAGTIDKDKLIEVRELWKKRKRLFGRSKISGHEIKRVSRSISNNFAGLQHVIDLDETISELMTTNPRIKAILCSAINGNWEWVVTATNMFKETPLFVTGADKMKVLKGLRERRNGLIQLARVIYYAEDIAVLEMRAKDPKKRLELHDLKEKIIEESRSLGAGDRILGMFTNGGRESWLSDSEELDRQANLPLRPSLVDPTGEEWMNPVRNDRSLEPVDDQTALETDANQWVDQQVLHFMLVQNICNADEIQRIMGNPAFADIPKKGLLIREGRIIVHERAPALVQWENGLRQHPTVIQRARKFNEFLDQFIPHEGEYYDKFKAYNLVDMNKRSEFQLDWITHFLSFLHNAVGNPQEARKYFVELRYYFSYRNYESHGSRREEYFLYQKVIQEMDAAIGTEGETNIVDFVPYPTVKLFLEQCFITPATWDEIRKDPGLAGDANFQALDDYYTHRLTAWETAGTVPKATIKTRDPEQAWNESRGIAAVMLGRHPAIQKLRDDSLAIARNQLPLMADSQQCRNIVLDRSGLCEESGFPCIVNEMREKYAKRKEQISNISVRGTMLWRNIVVGNFADAVKVIEMMQAAWELPETDNAELETLKTMLNIKAAETAGAGIAASEVEKSE